MRKIIHFIKAGQLNTDAYYNCYFQNKKLEGTLNLGYYLITLQKKGKESLV